LYPQPRVRTGPEESEWRMPNLEGLPIKAAIDKLAAHTSRIKVHGSGFVVDQSPKAFERLKGNSECAIYGRLYNE
jgi:beta-lactam-binding protein with PASTA domain